LYAGQATFRADSGQTVLDLEHPHNEVADTGLKATVYFQSVLPAITFNYSPYDGAASYRVRVYRAEDLKTPVVDQNSNEARLVVSGGKLGEGTYVWYAAPLDAAGAEMAGGQMNKLDIVYDNSMTTLAISRPKPGDHIDGSTVRAEGVAPLGAKLFVNGQPASLDAKGRFGLDVPRSTSLVFRVLDGTGRETYWVRVLKNGK
jgi:hypothetical protein